MPNGISCACFAIRNHRTAQTTNNAFREGIAAIQTVRTVDAASKINAIQNSALKPALPILSKITAVLRKCLYPLIIGSGVYTTMKSDDKVRTGFSQATGIGAMYCSEKVAEKALKVVDKKVADLKGSKYHKAIKTGWYVLKGLTYLSASLGGFKLGSKVAGKSVDTVRNLKGEKVQKTNPAEVEQPEVFKEFA